MDDWKNWIDNKIYLLSTPLGAGVGITGFVIGLLIGRLILDVLKGV